MPVTFYPAKGIQLNVVNTTEGRLTSPAEFLQNLPLEEIRSTAGQILQSSFFENVETQESRQGDCAIDLSQTVVLASHRGNGLVDTVLKAYNQHHHLVLRPDDVWTAVLSGLSFYVNQNAEELRSSFVAHEGRKKLSIRCGGTRQTVDFGSLAQQFTGLMHDYLIDKILQEWILPDFSTTTDNDRVVCSILMMATLKEYFSFDVHLLCGLPAVTLLGEREDWVKLHSKVDKLKQFGEDTTAWASLLDPILRKFVETFDERDSEAVSAFWNRIAHVQPVGSGSPELSGWITAFCFFNHEGRVASIVDSVFSPPPLVLDGVEYPIIAIKDIPPAFATVPVYLNDNGVEFETEMVSGSVAMKLSSSDAFGKGSDDLTAVQPLSGWAIYEKHVDESV
ncbi:hypothetical protein KEM54_000988 [Ascosphaera aggregata]|nr:hypothetical protein KEM54_000988 [Ascosphaera aggregata]